MTAGGNAGGVSTADGNAEAERTDRGKSISDTTTNEDTGPSGDSASKHSDESSKNGTGATADGSAAEGDAHRGNSGDNDNDKGTPIAAVDDVTALCAAFDAPGERRTWRRSVCVYIST